MPERSIHRCRPHLMDSLSIEPDIQGASRTVGDLYLKLKLEGAIQYSFALLVNHA